MIIGIEGMSDTDVASAVRQGGRFVMNQYCISIIVMTFRRSSDVYFLKPGEGGFRNGLAFTLITLFLGWWGVPWGPIYSVQSLYLNARGGRDVTDQILRRS